AVAIYIRLEFSLGISVDATTTRRPRRKIHIDDKAKKSGKKRRSKTDCLFGRRRQSDKRMSKRAGERMYGKRGKNNRGLPCYSTDPKEKVSEVNRKRQVLLRGLLTVLCPPR